MPKSDDTWLEAHTLTDDAILRHSHWEVGGRYLNGETSVENAEWVIQNREILSADFRKVRRAPCPEPSDRARIEATLRARLPNSSPEELAVMADILEDVFQAMTSVLKGATDGLRERFDA